MGIKFLNKVDVDGEVRGTSLDINGSADISGKLVLPQTSTTIGSSTVGNASLLVGSTTAGIGIDTNEIAVKGDHLYIGAIDNGKSIILRTDASTAALTLDSDQNATFTGNVTVGSNQMTASIFNGNLNGASTASGSCTGNAVTATTLATPRAIGGVSFDGSAGINLPGVNQSGNQDTSGTATNATNISVGDESSDTNCRVVFVTSNVGNLPPKVGSNLIFNSSIGLLTATSFNGSLTGNVTGNVSGSAGGSAAGLNYLDSELEPIVAHGVLIGDSDGGRLAQVAGNATASNKFLRSRGAANANQAPSFETVDYASISGTPTVGTVGSLNSINNSNWSGTDLSVGNGGTGRSSITSGNVVIGNGTGAINSRAIGISDNNIVEIDGSDIASGEFARFTANGLESRTAGEMQVHLNVEDGSTADQTQGDINNLAITTVGTIDSGVWQGSAINQTYLNGQSGTNTGDVTLASVTSNYLSITNQAITAGTVPVSLGGTGATDAGNARTNLDVDQAGTDNSTPVTLDSSLTDLLTLTGQGLSYNAANPDNAAFIINTGSGGLARSTTANARSMISASDVGLNILSEATPDLSNGQHRALLISNTGDDVGFSNLNNLTQCTLSDHSTGFEFDNNIAVGGQSHTLSQIHCHDTGFKFLMDNGGTNKNGLVILADDFVETPTGGVSTTTASTAIGFNQVTPQYGIHDSRPSSKAADWYLANGSIGVGTTPHKDDGRGDFTGIVTAVNVQSSSDARIKKDVKNIPSHLALNVVKQLQGVRFNWLEKHETSDWPERHQDKKINGVMDMGFIAQDVEKVLPEAVETDEDNKGFKTIAYGKMVAVLTEAIKEQQKQIDKLQKQINEL